jgi:hypothetical protein
LQVNLYGLQTSSFTSDIAFGINGDTNTGGSAFNTWRTVTNAEQTPVGRSDPFLTTGSGNMQNNQNGQAFVVTIPNYASTTIPKLAKFFGYYTFPSSNLIFIDGAFGNGSATEVTSIKIEWDGSATFSAGTMEIWGIK